MHPFPRYFRTAALFTIACAPACAGDASPSLGIEHAPIATEHGTQAEVVTRIYGDPVLSAMSFSEPTWVSSGGCSATMIGPNVLFTAAHCGDQDGTATFYTYQNANYNQLFQEQFTCHVLVNTFHHSDVVLAFCDPNALGENPGDKYGYLDLDASAPTVNQSVRSFWYNPIGSLNLGWAEIYSEGAVTATNVNI